MLRAAVWGALAGGAAWTAYAAACPRAQIWARGYHRGPRRGRLLALTFDDGPSESTPLILEALAREQVRGTFFVCGRNVERLPQVGREVLAAGHEFGNHTHRHRYLLPLGADAVRREVAEAQKAIEDGLGVSPWLFRSPYGVRSPWLGAALEECGLTEVQWTVIGRDWRLGATAVAARVLRQADAGGIVCLHDGDGVNLAADRRATAAALGEMLPRLRDAGYRFVTAGEMLGALVEEEKSV